MFALRRWINYRQYFRLLRVSFSYLDRIIRIQAHNHVRIVGQPLTFCSKHLFDLLHLALLLLKCVTEKHQLSNFDVVNVIKDIGEVLVIKQFDTMCTLFQIHRIYSLEVFEGYDLDSAVVGCWDHILLTNWMITYGSNDIGVYLSLMDELLIWVIFPNEYCSRLSRCDKIVKTVINYNICELVFFFEHVVVLKNKLSIVIMEGRFLVWPGEDAFILFEDFEAFYPEWHAFEFLLWSDLSVDEMAIRIKRQCLFWIKSLQERHLVHEAPINTSSN